MGRKGVIEGGMGVRGLSILEDTHFVIESLFCHVWNCLKVTDTMRMKNFKDETEVSL